MREAQVSERMITINEFLDNVLADFREYVDNQDKLCDLLDAHFDGGKVPDYSTKPIQQLYLLRYAYAYAFEYKCMYRELSKRINLGKQLKVTSIGCGNRLDYWSLVHAIGQNCSIQYIGLDKIDWSYRFKARSGDIARTSIYNAVDAFFEAGNFSSDIYIFPKSISEFTTEEVQTLANCFTDETIKKDTIHFMFSLRTSSLNIQSDIRKTKIFYDRLTACGFQTKDKTSSHYEINDLSQGKAIFTVDSEFNRPNEVIDYLQDLYRRCTKIGACTRTADCLGRLRRLPILTCKQAAWQIFTFKRQGAA